MAPTGAIIAPNFQNVRRSQHSSTTAAAATHNSTSEYVPALDPNAIAGVTIGILVALVLAFFTAGAIANCLNVRKRAKINAKIEAQHKRWESMAPMYPSLTAHYDFQPGAVTARENYVQPKKFGTGDRPDPEKIGIAVSPETARTESPESYQSHTSVSNLISKALPAVPLAYSPARPESNYTVFEDYRQSQISKAPESEPAQDPVTLTRTSSLRPRKPPPARIRIPVNATSPPPIKIFPPNADQPSRVLDHQQDLSRSTSSSPPNYNGFPAPPAARVPLANVTELISPYAGVHVPNAGRKETPSYLPAYYTKPTPNPPVTPIGFYQLNNPASEPSQTPVPIASSINTAALELDPSSASSNGSDTSFESLHSDNGTPPETQREYTQPLPTGPDSPLRNLRYPRIPRPSNQSIPRTPPSGTRPSHFQSVSSMSSRTPSPRYGPNFNQERQTQDTPTRPERKLRRVHGDVQTPQQFPRSPVEMSGNTAQGQQQQQLPQSRGRERQAADSDADQMLSRTQRRQLKLSREMRNGDMFIEIRSP